MRARSILVSLAVLGTVLAGSARAQLPGTGEEVHVRSNFYLSEDVYIEPGQKVTWLFDAGGHTVTADNGLFNFDPQNSVPQGQTREFVFPDQGGLYSVPYYCRVHGAPGGVGMAGTVWVGYPEPTPEVTPAPTPPPERDVPSEYPSLSVAVIGAAPGTIVNVAPGTYVDGNIKVLTEDITVRGTGASPAEVVLEGTGRNYAFYVTAAGFRLENLTVRDYRQSGVVLDGAGEFAIERVTALDNRVSGIAANGATRGAIRSVEARGSGEAGIAVRSCTDCDLVVEDVAASGNVFGYAGVNAGGVVVRDSTFEGNATGVFLATLPTESGPPQLGTHLFGNTITGNDGAAVERRGLTETLDAPRGIGVWVAGGWFDLVERNTVSGHDRYGVVVSWLGTPAVADRVIDNMVTGDGGSDLAWDGLGVGVCFSGNRRADAADPVTTPEGAQDLYPCGGPPTPGLPMPQVDVDLFGAATEHLWCGLVGTCGSLDP